MLLKYQVELSIMKKGLLFPTQFYTWGEDQSLPPSMMYIVFIQIPPNSYSIWKVVSHPLILIYLLVIIQKLSLFLEAYLNKCFLKIKVHLSWIIN